MKYYFFLIFLPVVILLQECKDFDSDCMDKIAYCDIPSYEPLMKKYCALSCNFCTTSTTPTALVPCIIGICPAGYSCINYLCRPSGYSTTPDPACFDKGYDCDSIKKYCNDPAYTPLMKENCAKTCGFCKSSNVSTTTTKPSLCLDKSPLCNIIKNFCYYPQFKNVMKIECAKTCNYCS